MPIARHPLRVCRQTCRKAGLPAHRFFMMEWIRAKCLNLAQVVERLEGSLPEEDAALAKRRQGLGDYPAWPPEERFMHHDRNQDITALLNNLIETCKDG